MEQRLKGKNAFVTGASSGIGRAVAIELAKQGANVALIARNRERLREVAGVIDGLGVKSAVFIADTSDRASIEAAVSGATNEFGSIDIAVCNAGIYFRCEAKKLSMEQIEHVMSTNFYGTLNTIYSILPHMLERKTGSIVTTVSMDGKKGVPPDAAYVSSKFALCGFNQVLRQELRGSGVHIGSVFPSRTDTPQIAHVKCPGVSPKVSPEMIARATVKCIAKRKKEVLSPFFPCKLLVLADAISPTLGDFLVRTLHLDGVETGEPIV